MFCVINWLNIMNNTDKNCLFCKIVAGKIDSEIIYEDEKVVVFKDIKPQAPIHILVVPRCHIPSLNEAAESIVGYCVGVARNLAGKFGIAKEGYRVIINCNNLGGQEIYHIHIHLLGGRQMKWPPG